MFDTSDLNSINSNVTITKKIYSSESSIKIDRTIQIEGYNEFTEVLYPRGVVFYDFEVFEYDWLVVIINPIEKTKTIIANNRAALKRYFDEHNSKIWVGYNNLHYDVPILKGILTGMNPKKVSDMIIVEGKREYEISKDFNKIKMYNYDVMSHISNPPSLKTLEAFMGDNIEARKEYISLNANFNKETNFEHFGEDNG